MSRGAPTGAEIAGAAEPPDAAAFAEPPSATTLFNPARKPLSHWRCSALNGADSGMTETVMLRSSRRRAQRGVFVCRRRDRCGEQEVDLRVGTAGREIGEDFAVVAGVEIEAED